MARDLEFETASHEVHVDAHKTPLPGSLQRFVRPLQKTLHHGSKKDIQHKTAETVQEWDPLKKFAEIEGKTLEDLQRTIVLPRARTQHLGKDALAKIFQKEEQQEAEELEIEEFRKRYAKKQQEQWSRSPRRYPVEPETPDDTLLPAERSTTPEDILRERQTRGALRKEGKPSTPRTLLLHHLATLNEASLVAVKMDRDGKTFRNVEKLLKLVLTAIERAKRGDRIDYEPDAEEVPYIRQQLPVTMQVKAVLSDLAEGRLGAKEYDDLGHAVEHLGRTMMTFHDLAREGGSEGEAFTAQATDKLAGDTLAHKIRSTAALRTQELQKRWKKQADQKSLLKKITSFWGSSDEILTHRGIEFDAKGVEERETEQILDQLEHEQRHNDKWRNASGFIGLAEREMQFLESKQPKEVSIDGPEKSANPSLWSRMKGWFGGGK